MEVQNDSLKAIEQEDLLHDILIRMLKKYKDVEFVDLETGYNQIKFEFLNIKNKFWLMEKPHTLHFVELSIKSENNDFEDI